MNLVKPEKIGLSSTHLNAINDLISSYIESNKIAGAITLVSRRGELAHFNCYGKMNLATNSSMQDDTIFRLYSMTKPVTSVAMMMLFEQGYFKLTTPVSEFIPEFKNLQVYHGGTVDNFETIKPQREMTIADLLCHTSGLTYDFMNSSPVDAMYRAAGIQGSHSDGTLKELVTKLAQLPLLFSPGTKWNYSLSTEVVAYLVEIISGQPFDEFVKTNITQPLGMVDTDFYVPKEKQDRFSGNYTHIDLIPPAQKKQFSHYMSTKPDFDQQQKLILIDDPQSGRFSSPRTFHSGGGGLVSTASDYLKFSQMLLNKGKLDDITILNTKTVELMTVNHLPTDLASFSIPGFSETTQAGVGFGLGFAIMLDPSKAAILGTPGEFGWGGGANTMFFVDPKKELIAILLLQLLPSTAYQIRREFRTSVYQSILD